MPDQFVEFDDALKELGVEQRELQAMIARGELRAFRVDGTLKMRREDVDKLKADLSEELTVVEPEGDSTADQIDLAADTERPVTGDTAQATVPVIEIPDLEDEAIEAIVPMVGGGDRSGDTAGALPTGISIGEDEATEIATEEVVLDDQEMAGQAPMIAGAETAALSGGEDEVALGDMDDEDAGTRTSALSATRSRRIRALQEEAEVAVASSPASTLMLGIAVVALLGVGFVVYGAMRDQVPDAIVRFVMENIFDKTYGAG